MVIISVVVILLLTALGKIFGLSEVPFYHLGIVGLIVLTYLVSAEGIKRMFYKFIEIQDFGNKQ